MDALKAAWGGKERLWKVFWIYNWLVGTALNVFLKFAAGRAPGVVLLVLGVAAVAWGIFVSVALWRCAFNSSWPGWGYMTRAVVVLGVIAAIFMVVLVFKGGDVPLLTR